MNRNILTDARPATTENDAFKARLVAGIPKMNFQVFAVTADLDFAGVNTPTDWIYIGGFKEADGLNATIEQTEYSDNSTNNVIIKNPGKINFDNISLRRGFDADNFCRQWHLQKGSPVGQSEKYMLDLVILKMTHDTNAVARAFAIRNAWVQTYTAEGMDDTTTDPWIEQLSLAHDGFMMVDVFDNGTTVATANAGDATQTYSFGADTATNRLHNFFKSIAYRYDYGWIGGAYVGMTPGNFLRGNGAEILAG
jgi:phage tail-like protein